VVEKLGKSETRDGFKFRGGHVALNLAATLAARLKPSPRELLAHPSDLGRWLVAAELTEAAPEVTQPDVALARTLREAIYSLAVAYIQRKALPDDARRKLNRLAAEMSAVPQLGKDSRIHLMGKTRELLVSIARDAILLFGSDPGTRLRRCEGESCALLFLDTSRSGERRWCSMSGCGNKSKIAEFRRRQRRSGMATRSDPQ
jgi:predicted RNA-binding Zn ribbon-like protein